MFFVQENLIPDSVPAQGIFRRYTKIISLQVKKTESQSLKFLDKN